MYVTILMNKQETVKNIGILNKIENNLNLATKV